LRNNVSALGLCANAKRNGERSDDGTNPSREVQLNEEGRELLAVLESAWFRALHRDPTLPNCSNEELTRGLVLPQLWPRPTG